MGIWLKEAKDTYSCGKSLANTLYCVPITILLSGEIGTGKTTFLNGFAEALGIGRDLPSPTFALEHRHVTADGTPFLHIDLYRLSGEEATRFVEQTSDAEGYRCIEWAQHLTGAASGPFIALSMEDADRERGHFLTCSFHDIPLPGAEQIRAWRDDFELPPHIARHCDAVAACAVKLGRTLMDKGNIVRLDALDAAGRVHDLLRFMDFAGGGFPTEEKTAEPAVWENMRRRYGGMRHEEACAAFLRDAGYRACADIVSVHGLRLPPERRSTIEQKLLYYADKRVCLDTVVSLEERFRDFAKRYESSPMKKNGEIWYAQAKELEEELFDGKSPLQSDRESD